MWSFESIFEDMKEIEEGNIVSIGEVLHVGVCCQVFIFGFDYDNEPHGGYGWHNINKEKLTVLAENKTKYEYELESRKAPRRRGDSE